MAAARPGSTCTRSAAGCATARADARLDDQYVANPLTDRLRERRIACRSLRKLHGDRKRRLLLHAGRLRSDEDVTADRGRELAHDLADGGGEDVHAADDEHVVRSPDAADARARAAARARGHPDLHVVARAEAQERRGTMAEVGQHELAALARSSNGTSTGLGVDQLGVDEPPGAQVHAVLLLALPPERHADVADAHRLGHPGAPALLEERAEGRLAAAGLSRNEDAPDARAREIRPAFRRPFDEVRRV